MLEKTGTDPDLDFADLSEAIESGVSFSQNPNDPAAIDRYKAALARFKLQDNRIMMAGLMADPQAALMNMLSDPHKFFADIRLALGNIPEGSFLDGALDMMENGIASYSEDPHIAAFMDHYDLQGAFKQVTDIQGRLGITELAETPAAPTTPAAEAEVPAGAAPVGDTAEAETPEDLEDDSEVRHVADLGTNPAVDLFNGWVQRDASIGVATDMASVEFGTNGKGFLKDGWNTGIGDPSGLPKPRSVTPDYDVNSSPVAFG
jgi:hypothetical protein